MKRVYAFLLCLFAIGVMALYSINQQMIITGEAEVSPPVAIDHEQSSGFLPRMVVEMNSLMGYTDERYAKLVADWREVNDDVVGYIEIADFDISYPVLQGETNKSYLRTNIYGEKDNAGCIFLDSNYPDIYSPVKLIHGHHMANGTMFGKIPDMLKWDTLDEAPHIFYTDDLGTKEFQIFSVFSVNSQEESVIVSQFMDLDEIEALKAGYIERSWVPVSEVPDSIEMLMLNTCWYGESGREHFLHCIVVAARV